MDRALPLIWTSLGFRLEGDDIVILIFSENLGLLELRFPLQVLADFTGVMADAIKE